MAFVECNNNPYRKKVGDCVVRAVSLATFSDWDDAYWRLAEEGFYIKDMPTANYVWGSYLTREGFRRRSIPNTCPECYSVRHFCEDHPRGTFILGTGTHAICVREGDFYDTWNSGDEVPVFYWEKG